MKLKTDLAVQYWIDNTDRIYEENLHVSTPVIEAYQAGFEKARELAAKAVIDSTAPDVTCLLLGEEEVKNSETETDQ